jgi:hypothetical protein
VATDLCHGAIVQWQRHLPTSREEARSQLRTYDATRVAPVRQNDTLPRKGGCHLTSMRPYEIAPPVQQPSNHPSALETCEDVNQHSIREWLEVDGWN